MFPHDDISHLAFLVSYGEILNVSLPSIADFIEDCISIYLMGVMIISSGRKEGDSKGGNHIDLI